MAAATVTVAACGSDDSADSGSSATTAAAQDETTTAASTESSAAESSDSTEASSNDSTADGGEITVAIVGNPQMEDIAALTPELFTAETGIKVNYSILEEGTLREVVTRDAAAGGDQFDVVMIGMYEAPQFGANGWVQDLTPHASADAAYNIDDLISSVRGGLSVGDSLYASPFYAESSFVMYRKDLLDAAPPCPRRPPGTKWPRSLARSRPTTSPGSACGAAGLG
ncbi:MAG: extracellular solute-binding protein [Ilumatobacteraceae bacterium]